MRIELRSWFDSLLRSRLEPLMRSPWAAIAYTSRNLVEVESKTPAAAHSREADACSVTSHRVIIVINFHRVLCRVLYRSSRANWDLNEQCKFQKGRSNASHGNRLCYCDYPNSDSVSASLVGILAYKADCSHLQRGMGTWR